MAVIFLVRTGFRVRLEGTGQPNLISANIMKQLSAQDAQFLYMETNKSLSHVTSVAILDPSTAEGGTVRFKQIIEHVRGRLHTSPIYKRRIYHVPLELDYPYWIEDEHFDIEYHIRHGRLPHPADWRQLCIHLARFHTRPLDMQRAPWEMYVIEGLDNIPGIPQGCYAVATKIHHAAADGMAIVNFFGGLMDLDTSGTPVMPVKKRITSERFEKPTPMQMYSRGLINGLRSPLNMTKAFMKYAPTIVQNTQKKILERNQEHEQVKQSVPITRFNLETSPHRVFDSTTFDLNDFKPLKELVKGSTINDLVLAICSGALRKYLGHHKELPGESLRAFVPVNVRPPKGSAVDSDQPGNNISTMSPLLYTNIADPLARLQSIYAETREQKAARKGISARLMTDVTRHIPASTQLLAARLAMRSEMAGRMTNVCISNVPGPQVPVYMNGAKVINQMGLGPLADRMGLFIAVTSYNGQITFSATSCRRTLPDVELFMEFLRQSFAELQTLAQQDKATTAPTETKANVKAKGKKAVKKKKASTKKATSKKTTQKKTLPKKKVTSKKPTNKKA